MKIEQTIYFEKWYYNLKDVTAIAAIRKRLDKIERENFFGDYKKIKGVKELYELRIHCGKGYRIYYTVKNNILILLISGGIKDNQKHDINKAVEILQNKRSVK
jgi:putative addiction module killer protein